MKKSVFLLIIFLIMVFNVSAQTANVQSSADLTIIEKKWRFTDTSSLTSTDNSDPFSANDQQRDFQRATVQNMRENDIRASQGAASAAPPNRSYSPNDSVTPVIKGNYQYQIKVKNTGQKTIRAVSWEYIFIDAVKNNEAGRREFTSKGKIAPGEIKILKENSALYPTLTVDASKGGKKFKDSYTEKIVVKKIEYEDGSVWNAQ